MISKMWSGRGKVGMMFNVVLVLSIVLVYHQLYLIFQQRGRRAERLNVLRSQMRLSRDLSNNGTVLKEKIVSPGMVDNSNSKIDLPLVKSESVGGKSKEKAVQTNSRGQETKNNQPKIAPPAKPNPWPAKPNPWPAKPNPGAPKPNPVAAKPNPGAPKPNPGAPKPNPVVAKPNPVAPVAVNPHPYYFTIHHPYKCKDWVFLLIIVTSSPQNVKQRQSIRQTWGNETNVPGVAIRTLFAIGKTNSVVTQQALEQEDKLHHDIIQENFVDSYHNLTHKTIMCLKYAFKFCPKARYLLKTDDDTFVNVFNLVAYLQELGKNKKGRIVVGEVWREGKPIQEQRRKWAVPSQDYPRESYPKYPNGFAYVISNDITYQVYVTSQNIKNYFLEDVYIGLCLEKLGIDLIDNEHFYNYFVDIDPCRHQKLIASHWVKEPAKMVKLWKSAQQKCERR
ncbi:PREDICTED: beta-1,3-galactosyltransferase 1-like [Branchiostoma belcheri]|uniref:Hexosyltransferase n=1 Tax=Branchiostoma belcheri TaxID=7741 RepID=A0A6P4ZRD6_BRABE|nr:PREDICTED: beta-1,3-galactosyltransferase 1-like [Branchiostoma belcheri]